MRGPNRAVGLVNMLSTGSRCAQRLIADILVAKAWNILFQRGGRTTDEPILPLVERSERAGADPADRAGALRRKGCSVRAGDAQQYSRGGAGHGLDRLAH